jgi:hypothetical protein
MVADWGWSACKLGLEYCWVIEDFFPADAVSLLILQASSDQILEFRGMETPPLKVTGAERI